jgi:hypothetical protein
MATLAELWTVFQQRPTRRWQSVAFPAENGEASLEAGTGYFQVRLAEMYLRYASRLWQTYAPATLFVCDFNYGTAETRVPFFVSNKLLENAAAGAGAMERANVRFRDTRVIGPIPYLGGDVAIFAGLFRTVLADERKALFSIFEKLFGACCASGLSSYVVLADKLCDELLNTLGMEDVKCLLAERNVFGTSIRPLASGYLALVDAAPAELDARQLSVVDNSLYMSDGAGTRPMEGYDYCLLRLETSGTRDDFTTLPFHRRWKTAQANLLRRRLPEANAALLECQSELLESDDVTETDKYRLVEFYQASFLSDQHRFMGDRPPADGERGVHRGQADGTSVDVALRRLGQAARFKGPAIDASVNRITTLVESAKVLPKPAPPIVSGQADSRDAAFEQSIQQHLRHAGPLNVGARAADLVHVVTESMLTGSSGP